jgi:hypothetical protein
MGFVRFHNVVVVLGGPTSETDPPHAEQSRATIRSSTISLYLVSGISRISVRIARNSLAESTAPSKLSSSRA